MQVEIRANVMGLVKPANFKKQNRNQETMKPTIRSQRNLALYPQMSYFIFRLLSVALDGGMSEPRARKLYDEILECFANIDGTNFWPFREELIGILKGPDKSFDLPDVNLN